MALARKAAPVSAQRRALIGKVHVARKEMLIDDESYRRLLVRVTGHASAADCSDEQLVRLVEEFRRLGWQAKPKAASSARRFTGRNRMADHGAARKARALWISLAHLGAVENASEEALEAFAKRQLGCETMQWADQTRMDSLIEALVAIGKRHGWDAKHKSVGVLKARLCKAILAKLQAEDLAAASWDLATAAERICGFSHQYPMLPETWEMGDLDSIAAAFGRLLKNKRRD